VAPRGPFMHWLGNPCWVSPYAPDNVIVTVPRAWTDKALSESATRGLHVSATFATWSLLFAHAIAKAYRPEGVP
jgi:hypothetical protein